VAVQAVARSARFVHAKVQAQFAVASIHKPEQDQRTQITSVPRTQRRQAKPAARQSGHARKVGTVARLGGDAREKRRQFTPRQPRRSASDKVADRQP
jgi:hypothetical protein